MPRTKPVDLVVANAMHDLYDGYAEVDELAASIAARGLIQPLAVRPADAGGKYDVIDGRRRFQAIGKLVMGDLFLEDVPDEWIDRVFAVMALCPQHTFQVLTKRSARMQAYMTRGDDEHGDYFERLSDAAVALTSSPCAAHVESVNWPLPNVWIGVSAEDQKRADERIPDLLATPAAVRFVSPPSDAAEARDTAAMIVAIIIKALVRDPVTDDVVLLRLHDLSAHALDQMSRELPSKHQPNPPTKDHA